MSESGTRNYPGDRLRSSFSRLGRIGWSPAAPRAARPCGRPTALGPRPLPRGCQARASRLRLALGPWAHRQSTHSPMAARRPSTWHAERPSCRTLRWAPRFRWIAAAMRARSLHRVPSPTAKFPRRSCRRAPEQDPRGAQHESSDAARSSPRGQEPRPRPLSAPARTQGYWLPERAQPRPARTAPPPRSAESPSALRPRRQSRLQVRRARQPAACPARSVRR